MTDNTVSAAEVPADETPVTPAAEPAKPAEGEEPEGEEKETEENPSEEDGRSDDEEEPKPRRPGKAARQIMRLEAQNDALSEQVRTLIQKMDGGAEKREAEPSGHSEARPRQEEFKTYEEFVAAVAKWEVRQEIAADTRKRQQEATQRQTEDMKRSFNSRCSEASSRYEDFEGVAFDPSVPLTRDVARAIMTSEKGPDLAYYLGSHPDEARAIASMGDPLHRAMALGRIEAKLVAPKPKKATAAPAPVKPVRSADKSSKNPDDMSPEEWRTWREGDLKKRGMR